LLKQPFSLPRSALDTSRLDSKVAPTFMIPDQQIPLGRRIPDDLHAVSVSIPSMADVIGYEERDPDTLAKMAAGYPRFVKHECLIQLESYWRRFFDRPNLPIWLTASERIAHQLESYLQCPDSKFLKHQGVSGICLPNDEELNLRAKLFLRHIGGYLCSREAEDYLAANGLRQSIEKEASPRGDSQTKVLDMLTPLLGALSSDDIALSSSGMNAIYSVFKTVNAIQSPKGRKSWIKLGWLYADTMHILDKLSPEGCDNRELLDVFDIDSLESLLNSRPDEFAGIITEFPTNPLIQSTDLESIRELATKFGVYLVVDPTVLSPANVDVSPYADVIVNSLTKYAANQGNVIAGAASVTPQCLDKQAVIEGIQAEVIPPYQRSLDSLARQIDGYSDHIAAVNASTERIVEFLESHPKVKNTYWAKEARSRNNFAKIARHENAAGGVVAFDLNMDLSDFYDRLRIAKGPSFGMAHSLACPFMYLAHYDLVTSQTGRDYLRSAGIDPELIRFSIGTEKVEEIIGALDEALG
jgi:cystathionine gamma-synthase